MKKNSELHKLLRTLFLVIIGGIVFGYLCTMFFTKYLPILTSTNTSISDLLSKKTLFADKEYVRIMLLGVDNSDKNGKGLSDTIVVFSINTKTKEIRGISFPRDTFIDIDGHREHKLNATHKSGGPEYTKEVLEKEFLYPVKIDYYIKTTTKGLREMVDLLGGVNIIVEKDMHYVDRSQDLYINLKGSPNKQLLNGRDAEGYVRFRKDRVGDTGYTYKDGQKIATGRIVRQQKFMVALCNRVISMDSKTKRGEFLKTCYDKGYIESNLDLNDWDALSDFFTGIKPGEIMINVLPGEPKMIGGGSYWVCNKDEVPALVAKNMLFEGANPKIVTDENGDSKSADVPTKTPQEVVMKILNGSGVSGLAAKAASLLSPKGFTNITTANADSYSYTKTEIRCRNANDPNAIMVKNMLGVGSIISDATLAGDITVIIGSDFK